MNEITKHTFQIQYIDNTYRIVDWAKEEWDKVKEGMESDRRVVILEDSLFVLSDIRTIVDIPPIEEEEPTDEDELTEWDSYEPDVQEYLRGIGMGPRPRGDKK